MRKELVVFLLLPFISPRPAWAQGVIPGSRVRVTASECDLSEEIGTLVSIEDGLLTAKLGRFKVECPVDALTGLEVSVGERNPGKATMVGLGIGIVAGAMGAAEIMPDDDNGFEALNALGPSIMWVMASISVGVVTGHVIGRHRGTDVWEDVPLPFVLPSLCLVPDGGLGIGVSIPLRR